MGTLDSLLSKDTQVIAVLCNQFGDTGKGKFSDFFAAEWADVVARGTGGNNAGHTVVVNGTETVYHILPAGIAHDGRGVVTLLGQGMVIPPAVLCSELDDVILAGGSYDNLLISGDASVIMPYHVAKDVAHNKSQKNGGIGSTGRGIGPAYEDKTARHGIVMRDLLNKDVLAKKIEKAREYYPGIVNTEEMMVELAPHIERLAPHITDTQRAMNGFIRDGRKICLEGAQGLLLSVEHGIHPYVTSSDCSLNGTAGGVGLPANAVDVTYGIFKFPFMTRVGGGPFPTELGGERSEKHCAEENNRETELQLAGVPYVINPEGKVRYDINHPKIREMMNDKDPFMQGIGIRLAAGEYGATTGRPRRTGWIDAVAASYAASINGRQKIILTKADALNGIDDFRMCLGYQYQGKQQDFTRDCSVMREVKPMYIDYAGYGNIRGMQDEADLPPSLKGAIAQFEVLVGQPVAIISTGPDRDETIIRK